MAPATMCFSLFVFHLFPKNGHLPLICAYRLYSRLQRPKMKLTKY